MKGVNFLEIVKKQKQKESSYAYLFSIKLSFKWEKKF